MDLQTNLSGAGLPSLRAASGLSAKTKESIYMDMTIAEVEEMEKKDGKQSFATDNLDKTKTVRQVLAEQKQMNAINQQTQSLMAAVAANEAQNESMANPWTASNAWNQALGPMANQNLNQNMNQNLNQNMNQNMNQNLKQSSSPNANRNMQSHYNRNHGNPKPLPPQPQHHGHPQPHQPQRYPPPQDGNGRAPFGSTGGNGRPRSWSDESAGSGGNVYPPQRPNYNQSLPFSQQQQAQRMSNGPGNRLGGLQSAPFNPAQQKLPKAFQTMAGFKPAAAGGLTVKSVGQKMGPQGLQHRDIRQPHQNPWDSTVCELRKNCCFISRLKLLENA